MSTVRTTIVLDPSLFDKLKSLVPKRRISRFINSALAEKIGAMEKEEILNRMKEGYEATNKDRQQVEQDWDAVAAEGWD